MPENKRLGAWEGPFTVDTPTVTRGGGVPVLNRIRQDFCFVMVDDCGKGGLTAAKARATRIAEALNANGAVDYETSLTMPEAIARTAHITEVFVGERRFIPEPSQ